MTTDAFRLTNFDFFRDFLVDGTANVVARLSSAGAIRCRKLVQVTVWFRSTTTVRSSMYRPVVGSRALTLYLKKNKEVLPRFELGV